MRPLLLVLGLMMSLGYYCSKDFDFFDTGFGRDTGAGLPTDSAAFQPGICGLYSGIASADSSADFRSTEAGAVEHGRSGTVTRSIADWQESVDSALFTVIDEGTWTVEGQENTRSTTRSSLRCDLDGVWLLGVRREYSYTANGTDYSGWVEEVPAEPMLILRPNLAVGSRWSARVQVTTTSSSGGTSEDERDYGYEVSAEESAEVAAGSFTTLKLVNTADQSVQWLDAEAGLVRTDELELVRWSP